MELEKAKNLLKEMQETNRSWLKETKEPNCEKIYLRDIEAIETVLQALEKLQQKEKSRIIGNINEIKIEDLESILKPYYIPKEKVRKELNDIENMIDKTAIGELQKYTVGELMLFRTIYNKLLEE